MQLEEKTLLQAGQRLAACAGTVCLSGDEDDGIK